MTGIQETLHTKVNSRRNTINFNFGGNGTYETHRFWKKKLDVPLFFIVTHSIYVQKTFNTAHFKDYFKHYKKVSHCHMDKMHPLYARWHWIHRLNFRPKKKRLLSSISRLILYLEHSIKNQFVHFLTCYNFVYYEIIVKTHIFWDICKKPLKNVGKFRVFNRQ